METYEAIREKLIQRRSELTERIDRVSHDVRHASQPLEKDSAEQVVQVENDEVLAALDESMRREIDQIQATLDRLERGEYGACVSCGRPISQKRLEALPHTTLCVTCAERGEE